MQVLMEIGTDFFLAAFANRVVAVPIDLCDTSNLPAGLVLDRLGFGTPTILSASQVGMPITAYLTTDIALAASGTAGPGRQHVGHARRRPDALGHRHVFRARSGKPRTDRDLCRGLRHGPAARAPDRDRPGGAGTKFYRFTDLTRLNQALGLPTDTVPKAVAIGLDAATQSVGILIDWDRKGPLSFMDGTVAAGQLPGTVSPAPGENFSLLLSKDIFETQAEQAIQKVFTGDLQLDSSLVPQWSEARKGQAPNPTGKGGDYHEALKLARKTSMRSITRLIELRESEDEQIATVASKALWEISWGKPQVFDPKAEALEEQKTRNSFDPRRYIPEELEVIEAGLRMMLTGGSAAPKAEIVPPNDD